MKVHERSRNDMKFLTTISLLLCEHEHMSIRRNLPITRRSPFETTERHVHIHDYMYMNYVTYICISRVYINKYIFNIAMLIHLRYLLNGTLVVHRVPCILEKPNQVAGLANDDDVKRRRYNGKQAKHPSSPTQTYTNAYTKFRRKGMVPGYIQ